MSKSEEKPPNWLQRTMTTPLSPVCTVGVIVLLVALGYGLVRLCLEWPWLPGALSLVAAFLLIERLSKNPPNLGILFSVFVYLTSVVGLAINAFTSDDPPEPLPLKLAIALAIAILIFGTLRWRSQAKKLAADIQRRSKAD